MKSAGEAAYEVGWHHGISDWPMYRTRQDSALKTRAEWVQYLYGYADAQRKMVESES